jgi:hypothetical protein
MRKRAVQTLQPGGLTATNGGAMLSDRDRGVTRDIAYPDCVISVMPDSQAGLGPEEIRALRVLADAGLLPTAPAYPVPTAPAAPVSRRTGSRGAGSRPPAPRSGYRKNPSHPQLKPHGPRPALRSGSAQGSSRPGRE